MLFKNKFASATLYKYLNILSLNNTIKLIGGKFMWKLINKEHPISIQSKFPLNVSTGFNN